jgi:hypothetical protein
VITSGNTLLAPIKTGKDDGFRIDAFDASTGAPKYSLSTDYTQPPHGWVMAYQPVLAASPAGTRLYYPGAGGSVHFIDNVDVAGHGAPVRRVFYTNAAYDANAAAFDASVFVNTPITADANGNIFFGFRMNDIAPAPLSTAQGGFARIDPSGNATYVLAGTAANDAAIGRTSHNSAPALGNDESTLYVVVKGTSSDGYGYLLGLDATTLATKYKVFLKDPRNGGTANALISDQGTSSATIGPDGDVYFGVLGGTSNGFRGFLLHFNEDLTVQKTPGGFGWDNTVAIVPKSMVPSYSGASPYLLFSKYNNYAASLADGADGVNRIAVLDPNDSQVDPHPSGNGLAIMREVLTLPGPTPDADVRSMSYPRAVKEWCINTAAVDPASSSILTPSEDGHLYRWNLATNSIDQALKLNPGAREPYVPTLIGPTGIVYTLSGAVLSAVGEAPGVRVSIASTAPPGAVTGQPVTLDVAVDSTQANLLVPGGTIALTTTTYAVPSPGVLASRTDPLAAALPLDASGHASFTTSALPADAHFVEAKYSGDAHFAASAAMRVQRVEPKLTATQYVGSTSTGSGAATLDVAGAGCSLAAAAFTYSWPPQPAGVAFPHGTTAFTASGCANGTLSATITYPTPLPADTRYWKYGPTPTNATPHWYILTSAVIDGNQVHLPLADGGLGDADGSANGTIVDPGGPAFPDPALPVEQRIVFNADVDLDGAATAVNDALLVLRHLFGHGGNALIGQALNENATLVSAADVKARLNALTPFLDIDGNGHADALTDGLLLIRYLSNLRGAELIAGAIGAAATRTTAEAIEAYIASLLP